MWKMLSCKRIARIHHDFLLSNIKEVTWHTKVNDRNELKVLMEKGFIVWLRGLDHWLVRSQIVKKNRCREWNCGYHVHLCFTGLVFVLQSAINFIHCWSLWQLTWYTKKLFWQIFKMAENLVGLAWPKSMDVDRPIWIICLTVPYLAPLLVFFQAGRVGA